MTQLQACVQVHCWLRVKTADIHTGAEMPHRAIRGSAGTILACVHAASPRSQVPSHWAPAVHEVAGPCMAACLGRWSVTLASAV